MGDLSTHFDRSELACGHCGQLEWDLQKLEELEKLRVKFGYPLVLSSAYRCPEHPNEYRKRNGPGAHTEFAIDANVHGELALRLFLVALDLDWKGYGVHQKGPVGTRYLHLDRMEERPHAPRPWLWSY